jgi:GT2 family glycosyltransferase
MVFDRLGGFDKNLSDYGNEKELLIRVRKLKLRTVHVVGCYIHHFGKASYARENINIGVSQKQADDYILKKHGVLK